MWLFWPGPGCISVIFAQTTWGQMTSHPAHSLPTSYSGHHVTVSSSIESRKLPPKGFMKKGDDVMLSRGILVVTVNGSVPPSSPLS
eukprot:45361-Eustigmatos_ZCMA.PRE.1